MKLALTPDRLVRKPNPTVAAPLPDIDSPVVHRAAAPADALFRPSGIHEAMRAYLPATIAVRCVNFIRVLLLTWWMLPQQFGLLSMILLAIQVLTPLAGIGLNEAVTRYAPQHEARGSLRLFVRRSSMLVLAVGFLGVLVMFALAPPLGDFLYAHAAIRDEFRGDAPELARLTAIVLGEVVIYYYLLALFKGLRLFRAIAAMETGSALLFLAAAGLAAATGHLSAVTITLLQGVSLALPIAYFGLRFRQSLATRADQDGSPAEPDWIRRLLAFSVWTMFAGVMWQIMLYYPTWNLNKTSGHQAVAVFSAARQIGHFVLIGAGAIVTVVLTTVTNTWEGRGREAARRQLSLAFRGVGMALLLMCGAAALSRHLIIRLFRPEYAAGADILPLHLLFFLIASYLALLPIHFNLIEKSRHAFWPWAIGVAANVLLALWLTGPRLAEMRLTTAWSTLTKHSCNIFVSGFSDPLGLGAAAWCGVLAIGSALAACLALLRAEDGPRDRGSLVVIGAAGLLAMNSWILAAGLAALIVSALRTEVVFTRAERTRLLDYARGVWFRVPRSAKGAKA